MGRRFTFPLLRVTLFICWVSLLLAFQNSFGSNNLAFPTICQANFKVAFIPNSVFPVHDTFEHKLDIIFETKLIKFPKMLFLTSFSSRKGDINANTVVSKINFPLTYNGYRADFLSALRIEKYAISTISGFLYLSATAHFYTPI